MTDGFHEGPVRINIASDGSSVALPPSPNHVAEELARLSVRNRA